MPHVDRGVGCNFCLAVFVNFVFSSVLTGLAIAQSMQGEADAVRPISVAFCADMRAHHVLGGSRNASAAGFVGPESGSIVFSMIRLPNTIVSRSELLARRLAPWTPVQAVSPQA